MPVLEIVTHINAPKEICFQLALSVDLHTISTQRTQETIVAGVKSGLLQLGESVTFRARHFGVWQTLTSKVTEMHAPTYFCDEMQKGAFKRMRHEHHFRSEGSVTIMRDVFAFKSPLGWLGKVADIILKPYLRRFLVERCAIIKQFSETEEWRKVLSLHAAYEAPLH
ncbi:SRPBCC family protein [Hymenobacter glacialis]|uniref:Cell division protein n=1 Tax=Hymenobacter glacialis TaxID=1908236 RepID=A0A1G1T7S0_9BACT|nr:SRPBCC family protein [Hymenobacter glacialis]OGX86929.1 cell division protein [Hymenobacter glacialis]